MFTNFPFPEAHEWLYVLQRPWPLTPRPLMNIAQTLGTTEHTLVSFIDYLREQGIVRRIGGVFDARQLGYRSCLFAITATGEHLEQAAAEVAACPGVTHVYTRGWPSDYTRDGITASDYEKYPNLWYTLSARTDYFETEAAKLAHWSPRAFPAVKRFKIDVVFDTRTRARDEMTEYKQNLNVTHVALPSEIQQSIIRRYQGDTQTPHTPFLVEDLPQLQAWFEKGILRRYALLLRHRTTGFTANAMCCWDVPEAQLLDVGRTLSAESDVTHCYARPKAHNFPFSIYAMIHKTSWDEAYDTFCRLSSLLPHTIPKGQAFFSLREFKKTSLSFFTENSD